MKKVLFSFLLLIHLNVYANFLEPHSDTVPSTSETKQSDNSNTVNDDKKLEHDIEQNAQTLYLELATNYRVSASVFEVKILNDIWYLKKEELVTLNISWPLPNLKWISLDKLGIHNWQYKPEIQRLNLFIDPKYLPLQNLNPDKKNVDLATRSTGFYLNYSAYTSKVKNQHSNNSLFHEAYWFTPNFSLSSTGLYSTANNQNNTSGYRRFDTRLMFENEEKTRIIQIGDVFNQGTNYLPSYRVGGIRIGRDFALNPTEIYYPLPEFLGIAEIPSALDLWINNQQIQMQNIDSGPFRFDLQNSVTGFNSASIVTRDIQGREVVQNINFYVATQLLRKGLLDYDFTIGFLRESYGTEEDNYSGTLVSTGKIGYGVNSHLTAHAVLQNADNKTNLAAGFNSSIFNLGMFSFTYLNSFENNAKGFNYSYDFSMKSISFYLSHMTLDKDYQDVITFNSLSQNIKKQTSLGISKSFNTFGQLSLSYNDRRNYPKNIQPAVTEPTLSPDSPPGTVFEQDRQSFTLVSWSKSINTKAYISARYQIDNVNRNKNFSINFNYRFGENINTSYQYNNSALQTSQSININKSSDYPFGYGWTLSSSDMQGNPIYADVSLNQQYGSGAIRYSAQNSIHSSSAEWRGAAVYMDNEFFITRHINEAFALVDTGHPDVSVVNGFGEKNAIKNTGRKIVPDVSSYIMQKVQIDTSQLSENTIIKDSVKSFKAKRLGGVLVSFDIKDATQVRAIAQDSNNKLLPAGAILKNNEQEAWVGWDGQLYLENTASFEKWHWEEGKCVITLPQLKDKETNDLGTLTCEREH